MKSKAEMMKRLRDERIKKNLVELKVWLTVEQREKVKVFIDSLESKSDG